MNTNLHRFSAFVLSLAAGLLLAASANAQATFSMTGKAATGSGAFVDLPAEGNAPCPEITGALGFAKAKNQKFTGMLGATSPGYPPTGTGVMNVALNPGGCIPGGPAVVMTNGTGGFTVPAGFFKQPRPGLAPGGMGGTPMDLNVTPVPNNANVVQLATSFQFTGPQAVPFEPINPKVPGVLAPWRKMKHGAYASQTGRVAPTFTVCPGNLTPPACPGPSGGAFPAILKNLAGTGLGFGGTMGLVLLTSPAQISSLVIKGPPLPAGFIAIAKLSGQGSRAPGRGYAAYDTDLLMKGPVYTMYQLTMPGPLGVVKQVTGYLPLGMSGKNRNYGFPFTTGSIIVRGTGSDLGGGIAGQTVTAKGFDNRTVMGAGQIQLVAGGFAQSNIQGNNGTPNYTVVRLPEPGAAMQLLAVAVGLLGIGAWRARKARG